MNLLKYISLSMALSGGIAALTSCDRLIEVSSPANLITAEKIFEDSLLLEDALLNCYLTLDFHEQFLPYLGLYVDELTTASQLTQHQEFLTNALTPESNLGNLSVWRSLYSAIYQANFIVEGLEQPGGELSLSPAYRRVLGEAKFVRAYSYFYLVNLWGDVPLVLIADVSRTAATGRHPVSEVYDQIIADLTDARMLLSAAGTQAKSRAGAAAATALLSRVLLYRGDWSGAERESATVIAGFPPLEAPLEGLFKAGHPETIFELWKERGYSFGATYIPATSTGAPTLVVRDGLLELLDEQDGRRSAYVSVNGSGLHFPYKYKLRTVSAEPEYDVLLRLPELYLINAEAKLMLGDITGSIDMLNAVRQRAGLAGLDHSLPGDAVVRALIDERARELFCEGGHRFFDLKRLGLIDEVMAATKPTWESGAKLFPIPQQEMDRNPRLTQNEGYN
jgi:SusD family.